MQAEQVEIAQFLAQHPPFDDLPTKALNELAQQVEVAYYRSQTDILTLGQDIADLFVIRSGSVEIYRRNNELYNRLEVGGIFGQMGLLMNRKVRFPAKALEDTLVYCINVDIFNRYCDEFDSFADYFEEDGNVRLRQAIRRSPRWHDPRRAGVRFRRDNRYAPAPPAEARGEPGFPVSATSNRTAPACAAGEFPARRENRPW